MALKEVVPQEGANLLPQSFRDEVILTYESQRFPFLKTLCAVLGEPADADLALLHESELGRQIIKTFHNRPKNSIALGPRGNPWNQRFHSCPHRDPNAFATYMTTYHDFLREFVLAHLETRCVAFQAAPTFRCHLPGTGTMGRPHRDEDYHHAPCEVNFWVPATQVFGSNSLYAESSRGAGDFHPFELGEGQLVRFYGNQVWHYTVPNDTEATRVSIDFRVIREEEWSPDCFQRFQLGSYYSVMTPSGVLPRNCPDLLRLQAAYGCPAKRLKVGPEGATSNLEIQAEVEPTVDAA